MANLDQRRIDPQKEADGIWVGWFEDVEIKIAHALHPDYKNAMERILRNFRRKKPDAPIGEIFKNEEEARKQLAPHVAKHLLLDWRNVQDVLDDGTIVDVPYSFSEAMKLLGDPSLDFFDFVTTASRNEELFRKEDVDDDAKNSDAPSDGSSTTAGRVNES